jgi:predicted phage baseplate assembly protein
MTLPAPSLDDRRFQDIVDEAKRRIVKYCPDWTDHNVSDPGVALIELFAWMTEMILYRVNQVPDRLYVKFLELVGIELFSAAPARTDVLFELAAPPREPVRIPSGTQVGTVPSQGEEQIVFMTEEDLTLVQPTLSACLTRGAGRFEDHTDDLGLKNARISCFPSLQPGDALYLGFEQSLGGHLIRLDITGELEGAGIDPRNPPRTWESWDGRDWRDARIIADTTDGFNSAGAVTLLLATAHEPLAIGVARAHWVRCRLLQPAPDQPTYRNSPELDSVTLVVLGGAVVAHHGEPAPAELLGVSTGDPGQVFQVRRAPVLPRRFGETVQVAPPRRELGREAEAEEWTEVADFADATEDDRVFSWSGATGEIRFGPRLIARDGRARQHGAVPEQDAQIRVTGYRHGGGRRANVGAGKLSVLLTTIPSVAAVRNLEPAVGGVDAETVENAKVRGPLHLRGGQRAVTAADFERLALEAAPGVARARCLPPTTPGEAVRLLIVPRVDVPPESLVINDLALPPSLEDAVKAHLDGRRLLTTRVRIDVPSYQGVKVVAEVHAAPTVRPEKVRADAELALYRYINPVIGGPDGRGWPFDLDLSIGDVFALLRAVPGIVRPDSVHLFFADPLEKREPEEAGQRIRLAHEALFLSVKHRVVVRQ